MLEPVKWRSIRDLNPESFASLTVNVSKKLPTTSHSLVDISVNKMASLLENSVYLPTLRPGEAQPVPSHHHGLGQPLFIIFNESRSSWTIWRQFNWQQTCTDQRMEPESHLLEVQLKHRGLGRSPQHTSQWHTKNPELKSLDKHQEWKELSDAPLTP